jgi:two-component system response regulator AtoC
MQDLPAEYPRRNRPPEAADLAQLHGKEILISQFAVEASRTLTNKLEGASAFDDRFRITETSYPQTIAILRQIAATNANVLIVGESGTGKESIAEVIHAFSRSHETLLAKIDCAGIPPSRINEELFGGYSLSAAPLLELCRSGNVFWDEVFALPENAQERLHRAMQSRSFKGQGNEERIFLSARFLSATNRNVKGELLSGRFRTDLYDRLATIKIRLLSLREQPDEILLLADWLLQRLTGEAGTPKKLHHEVQDLFQKYSWPGNLRQLRQALEHAVQIEQDTILTSDLPAPLLTWSKKIASLGEPATGAQSPTQQIHSFDRNQVQAVLMRHSGSVKSAAEELGVSRQGFYKMLKRHSISPDDYRS